MPDIMPIFGLLIVDREPFTFPDLPGLIQAWLMDAGGFAFFGLVIYLIYAGIAAVDSTTRSRIRITLPMLFCTALALISYSVYAFFWLNNMGVDTEAAQRLARFDPNGYNKYVPPALSWKGQPVALSLAGLFSILGIGAPFFAALAHMVRRAASTGRAPTGTPGLYQNFGLLALCWVVIVVAARFARNSLPAARETIGAVAVFALLGSAAYFAYRCRLWDRMGAVFAVAKLSVLDVIRSRVFLALLLLLLPALFPITWFIQYKPEDELRLIIGMSSSLTQFVLLLMAAALAAFAIPNDVKNQNIYTVLTKPVQPFDVVLGRFLGYSFLATLGLVVMTFGSWILIEGSNIGPKAREETFKARVPLRGKLRYESRAGEIQGTDVGREFNYRKYIAGHPTSSQRAVWGFSRLPQTLQQATADAVPVEFTFDIYRLTKGVENRGVDVNIRIVSWRCPQKPPERRGDGTWIWADNERERKYETTARQRLMDLPPAKPDRPRPYSEANTGNPKVILSNAKPGSPEWTIANDLAKEFGFYEIVSREVYDYHPTTVLVPAGLFENATTIPETDGKRGSGMTDPVTGKEVTEQVVLYVKCDSSSQMLGMAEGDLYILEAEQSFGQNYFKAAFGLWCRLLILIALAVVCSTYLTGVVSFVAAGMIFVVGYFGQYITELAMGKGVAGGPVTALSQISQAKLPTAPDDGTAGARAAALMDSGFSWAIRRIVNLFPDVYAYDWKDYLVEGFNVSFENLAMNFIVMVGYILPWMILGFYLIRSREVAA